MRERKKEREREREMDGRRSYRERERERERDREGGGVYNERKEEETFLTCSMLLQPAGLDKMFCKAKSLCCKPRIHGQHILWIL